MGQHKENTVIDNDSLKIANAINKFSARSGSLVALALSLSAIIIIGFTVYSKISLINNSGYYEILTTNDGGIENEFIIDKPRYFDDRLALIINGTSLMLADLFHESTSSFPQFKSKINKYTEDTGGADAIVNFRWAGVENALRTTKVSILKFTMIGTPQLKEPHFRSGIRLEDVRPISALNDLIVDKWTLEVTGKIVVKQVTREVKGTEKRIKFFVDVYSNDNSYNSDSIIMLKMTKWVLQ